MSWWSSVVDGVYTVGSGLGTGAAWAWNKSIGRVVTTAITYSVNTTIQALNQVLALPTAAAALVNKPESRKILNGMGTVLKNDIIPIVGINFVNTAVQTYCRKSIEENPAAYTAYSVLLGALTLADYGVRAYTWRQGVQTLIHITTLDVLGPQAFNADSARSRITLCKDEECTTKRVWKGKLREPMILAANDGLVWGISNIPYVGTYASKAIKVLFNGRYIARLATPDLCERHKFQFMMQEATLALGLTHELCTMLMDVALEHTVGMPPYLYHRAINHLLLLGMVNLAAHMTLPVIKEQEATLPIDPLNMYERTCRFFADVLFAGLMVRLPIDFKFDPDAEPLIPLNPTLQLATKMLNSDLEVEKAVPVPTTLNKITRAGTDWLLPPILRGTNGVINDPILKMYWPQVRKDALSTIELVRTKGKAQVTTAVASWIPGSWVAFVLQLKFGVPEALTVTALKLTKEEDVWNFIDALQAWFERHNVACEVVLSAPGDTTPLGGRELIVAPNQPATLLPPAEVLMSKKRDSVVPITDPKALLIQRDVAPVLPVNQLLARRADTRTNKALDFQMQEAPTKTPVELNPNSLFTTRRRGVPTSAHGSEHSNVNGY